MVIISKAVLDKIRIWSSSPFDKSKKIDSKLVRMLLVKLVGMVNLAAFDVGDDVKSFVKGI